MANPVTFSSIFPHLKNLVSFTFGKPGEIAEIFLTAATNSWEAQSALPIYENPFDQ